MKLSQRKVHILSRFMLATALFAQGILAAHACVGPFASAAQALSGQQSVEAMQCHEAARVNSNECLMHCTQSDQINLDQHAMSALPANDIAIRIVVPHQQHKVLPPVYAPLVLNSGPPLSIRFCIFRI